MCHKNIIGQTLKYYLKEEQRFNKAVDFRKPNKYGALQSLIGWSTIPPISMNAKIPLEIKINP